MHHHLALPPYRGSMATHHNRADALEEAEDIRAAQAALAEPGPDIPMSEVWADYADLLGPYPQRP